MLAKVSNKSKEEFLAGGSQLSELINTKDWSATPLGPIERWPQSLKTSVNLILNSQHPMWIGWGPKATFLYNDAYIHVLSEVKHPWALGRPASEVWAEIWDVCGPLADKVFREGQATYTQDVRLFMNRGDFFEETFFSFSYSPIYDESGAVAGLFCPSAETTAQVLHTRRLKTLSELSSNTLVEKTINGACTSAFRTIAKNADDIPFAALYLTGNDRKIAHLEASTGLDEAFNFLLPQLIPVNGDSGSLIWPVAEALARQSGATVNLEQLKNTPKGCNGYEVSQAIVLPVISAGQEMAMGFLIAAVNPCRKLDADYRTFYELVANQIAIALQNATAAEEERRRMEMLAELDRAKTVFFSNVSHEFRTPLTLMLGPIENILNRNPGTLSAEDRQALESTHRNAMRLFRLVNTLLDFSRIEAGRITASFSAVDLAAFTADLASNFRSVIENAGLRYEVSCEESHDKVLIDRSMWEKIVFNLLSNAFKFTLQGTITITLQYDQSNAILTVADTGIGIPPDELPHVFDRFHRVRNAAGRTFEGTGIGLSLVKELVEIHEGTIEAESREGVGTTFVVRIPMDKHHLPAGQVQLQMDGSQVSSLANVYVKELESLMGGRLEKVPQEITDKETVQGNRKRVLLVDDNADMRQYIRRMLSQTYIVEEADNGKNALAMVQTFAPDLIISDIMMPVMDGIEFLQTMKRTPQWSSIPVILLSARAGEEARIEGYDLGADDYLVKPFSINELNARVKAQIRIAKTRQHAETHLRNLFQQAPVIIVVFRGPDFIVEIANEKLLEYWDKSLEQVLHRPLIEILPEVAGQGLIELLTDVLTNGVRRTENEREVPLLRNGKYETTYVSYVYEPLRNDDGEITHVMVLANDVTESVLARRKIEISESKFRNLVIQAPVGIAILRSRDFVVEVANETYLSTAGRKAEDLVGRPFFDVLVELRDSGLPGFLNHVLDTGESYFGSEFPVTFNRDGRLDTAYFNFVYQPLKEDDAVSGVICVVVEVTEIVRSRKIALELAHELEKRVEERTHELKISNEKLAASNRELEQFAYIASHDLQEPLRKIQTFAELVQKHIDDRAQAERYVQKIDSSASRMSILIKDVLNYSRLTFDREPFDTVDLNQVLKDVVNDLELLIQEKHATIHSGKLPKVPGVSLQMHQLFANLIGNSLKFSREAPTIRITAEELQSEAVKLMPGLDPARKYVRLTFADNGTGFEQEYAEKIFMIFQRLHYGVQAGTGIGLALCKRIAERHGGTISARGELNRGATFEVCLPASE